MNIHYLNYVAKFCLMNIHYVNRLATGESDGERTTGREEHVVHRNGCHGNEAEWRVYLVGATPYADPDAQ